MTDHESPYLTHARQLEYDARVLTHLPSYDKGRHQSMLEGAHAMRVLHALHQFLDTRPSFWKMLPPVDMVIGRDGGIQEVRRVLNDLEFNTKFSDD